MFRYFIRCEMNDLNHFGALLKQFVYYSFSPGVFSFHFIHLS